MDNISKCYPTQFLKFCFDKGGPVALGDAFYATQKLGGIGQGQSKNLLRQLQEGLSKASLTQG